MAELFRTSQVGTEIYTRLTNLETIISRPLPDPTGNPGKIVAVTPSGTGYELRAVSGTGTVTSVSGSGGTTGLTLTGGPITAAGTLTLGGTLVVGSGGTGLSSITSNQLVYGGSSALTQSAGFRITTSGTADNLFVGVGGTGNTVASLNLNGGSGATGGARLSLAKNTSGSNIQLGHGSFVGVGAADDTILSIVNATSFSVYIGLSSIFSVNSSILTARALKPTTFTVATLPSGAASGQGARAHVSDANSTTFNSAVAGGGANSMPVFVDGAGAWRIG